MASHSRVSPSEKGPVGSGGSPPRQRQAHSVKSPFLSGVLCHISSCKVGVQREPQDVACRSQGPQHQLRVGRPAGAAAGFAVVPVAAEVHFDGQCAVGARLVLAAVIWGWDTIQGGRMKCQEAPEEQLLGSPTLAKVYSQSQELTKGIPE